ncbi:MAG: hypothetical protein ACE5ES_00365 [Candidatus Nanoarchaeia archaeon]
MLKRFLEEVVVIVVGKQAEPIASLLDSKNYVNEFLIAKKLDITINQTRNILYKLSDHGLVSSIRKKDKKKGWYTYFWKIEILKSLEFLKTNLIKKIDQINHQIKSRETKQFYVCERCNIEYSEENALLRDFTCVECGEIFTIKDNSKLLKEFGKNLDRLNKELDLVEIEISKERDKLEKKKIKELKKEEREKTKKRAERRRALAKVRKKKIKKKKPAKKKSKKKKVVKKKISKKKIAKAKVKKKKSVKKKSTKKKKFKKKIVRKPLRKKSSKKKSKKGR